MIFLQTAALVPALLSLLVIDLYGAEARSVHHLQSPELYLDNAYPPDPVLANPQPVLPVTNLGPLGPGLYDDIINQAKLTDLPYSPVANGISTNVEVPVLNGLVGELADPLVSYNQLAVPIGEALTTPLATHSHSLYTSSHAIRPLLADSLFSNRLSRPYTSPHRLLPQSLFGYASAHPWNSVSPLTHGSYTPSAFGLPLHGRFNPLHPSTLSLNNLIGTALPYHSLAAALPITV